MRLPRILTLFVLFLLVACAQADNRPELIFSPDSLPAAALDEAYQATISISQNETPVGSFALVEGELPPGLSLHYEEGNDTAEISGTPTESGSYTFTIEVWCFGTNISGQTGQQSYVIEVP